MNQVSTFLLLLLLCVVEGYPDYNHQIPNSRKVQSSRRQGKYVGAIGHANEYGGGPLNAFGEDFISIGRMSWSIEFCRTDSDGDGKSNGEELGDPDCVWKKGDPDPEVKEGEKLSHPGIPQDVEDYECKEAEKRKQEGSVKPPTPVPRPQIKRQG